jgi:hypothetical protein
VIWGFGEAAIIGRTVSDYRILRKLGERGMGVVYAAEELSHVHPFAAGDHSLVVCRIGCVAPQEV